MRKKIMAVVSATMLAMTMVISASANTALLTGTAGAGGDNNGTVDLSSYAGQTLSVTITCTDPSSCGNGWGLGGLCAEGTWSVDEAFQVLQDGDATEGQTMTVTYSVDEVTAALGSAPNVNFYNGWEVVTAEIVDEAAAETTETTEDATNAGAVAPVVVVALVGVASAAVVASKKRA